MASIRRMRKTLKGIVLIEALTFLFLFAVVSFTFLEVYITGSRMIIESKNRLGATALANQKMEIIRSIEYDSIGTKRWNGTAWVYGIPAGDILEDEAVSVNASQYNIHTFVQYVDDSFDGVLSGSPNDTVPNDYKRVRLTVSWGSGGDDQSIAVFANFSPNGVETSAGGGVFSINIIDATGSGVSGATVHIENSSTGVDVTTSTDSTGNIMLPGTPAGTQSYELTVSKGGYYGAITYAPSASFSPVDAHASVVADVLNQVTMVIDQDASMNVESEDPFGTAVSDVAFTISGGRVLGSDLTVSPATSVYGFSQTTTTDGSGEESFSDQSYGMYTVSGVTKAGYTFYKITPDGTTVDGFDVSPGVDKNISLVMLDDAVNSLWVKVTNQSDSTPIQGATVHLVESVSGYDVTLTTDVFGYVYFPESLPALVAGSYDLEVSATGFQSDSSTIGIGGGLVEEAVALNPS
ncbi:MAG: carboxypeptidase regulatory-like domain-containing protein [Candidatus Moranbacteria bacterium]|nr:carboxypeptidase regulatory-like domain-containing protein [Candidatus Moranbacteria bacterium]